ncbi:hypothetical protein KV205_34025 [Streptomyces sp. SKN60]|uniref:Rv1733c family protein n=1 Tax=Streptomyces sp. SKN60 TaxID=2855506 RepID=UPI002247D690|nr:hypothetical protein [Streptomyces sp. SKN60]MCX2185492.1 hypothetical protein [Streptomyces sp. SKN60]
MRAATGLWRWRHNPLRRTTDLVEAWVAVMAAFLLFLAVPAAGWAAGVSANTSLQHSVRLQQRERVPTVAQVVRTADTPAEAESAADRNAEPGAEEPLRPAVVARWTAPDGSARTGTVTTSRDHAHAGAVFPLWTDRTGRAVTPPMHPDTARAHALIAGLTVALLSAFLVESARRLVVHRLMRRRYARLDRAWAQVGPDWGRTGTGS